MSYAVIVTLYNSRGHTLYRGVIRDYAPEKTAALIDQYRQSVPQTVRVTFDIALPYSVPAVA